MMPSVCSDRCGASFGELCHMEGCEGSLAVTGMPVGYPRTSKLLNMLCNSDAGRIGGRRIHASVTLLIERVLCVSCPLPRR